MFELIINHVLGSEGGFVNRPQDKGGPTNHGITQAALSEYRGEHASVGAVRDLTKEEAIAIYKKNYWDANDLDLVTDPRIQLVVFDQIVNRGPKSAISQAQNVLKELGCPLEIDGQLGPKTAAGLNFVKPVVFCRRYLAASQMFYARICESHKSQLLFLRGWLHRTHMLDEAVYMLTEASARNDSSTESAKPEVPGNPA